jgi:hypothetical protein
MDAGGVLGPMDVAGGGMPAVGFIPRLRSPKVACGVHRLLKPTGEEEPEDRRRRPSTETMAGRKDPMRIGGGMKAGGVLGPMEVAGGMSASGINPPAQVTLSRLWRTQVAKADWGGGGAPEGSGWIEEGYQPVSFRPVYPDFNAFGEDLLTWLWSEQGVRRPVEIQGI